MEYRAAMLDRKLSPRPSMSAFRSAQADRRGQAQRHTQWRAGRADGRHSQHPQQGTRLGNWLTREQAKELLTFPTARRQRQARRRYSGLLVGARCAEPNSRAQDGGYSAAEGRWVIADLRGKGGRIRTVASHVGQDSY